MPSASTTRAFLVAASTLCVALFAIADTASAAAFAPTPAPTSAPPHHGSKAKVVCADSYASGDCTGSYSEDCYLIDECSDSLSDIGSAYFSSCDSAIATLVVFDSDICSGPSSSTQLPIGKCSTDVGFGFGEDGDGDGSTKLVCKDACDIHRSLTKGEIIKNVVMLLLGIVTCFAGYRLFKFELFLVGFVIAGGLTYVAAGPHINSEAGVIGASVGAGVVGGFLAIALFFLGIFCIGALFGALIVIVLLHAAHNSASTWIEDHNYAFYSATGGVALVMGILAVKFARTLIIVATSFSGAYSIMSAIDGFAENGRLSVSLLSSISSESPSVFQHLCWFSYVILSTLVVFFVAGMLVQFKVTARNFDHTKVETVPQSYNRMRGSYGKGGYNRVPANNMDSYDDDDDDRLLHM